MCLIWTPRLRDYRTYPSAGARLIASGIANNPLTRPLVLPWLRKKFAAAGRG